MNHAQDCTAVFFSDLLVALKKFGLSRLFETMCKRSQAIAQILSKAAEKSRQFGKVAPTVICNFIMKSLRDKNLNCAEALLEAGTKYQVALATAAGFGEGLKRDYDSIVRDASYVDELEDDEKRSVRQCRENLNRVSTLLEKQTTLMAQMNNVKNVVKANQAMPTATNAQVRETAETAILCARLQKMESVLAKSQTELHMTLEASRKAGAPAANRNQAVGVLRPPPSYAQPIVRAPPFDPRARGGGGRVVPGVGVPRKIGIYDFVQNVPPQTQHQLRQHPHYRSAWKHV